jgi:uncharacterized membrane protein YcfT
MKSSTPNKQRMYWMDILRGLAIGLVVMYHSVVYMYEKYSESK